MPKIRNMTNQGAARPPVISQKMYYRITSILEALVFALVFLAIYAIFSVAMVPSESMESTLHVGDKFLYRYTTADDISYDDVVVFFPYAEMERPVANGIEAMYRIHIKKDTVFVKRVIGLPGDVLEMKDGYVYRNGEKLDPNYVAEPMITNGQTYIVPDGAIFCMGDNRNRSNDSRYLGSFPMNNFFGKMCVHF